MSEYYDPLSPNERKSFDASDPNEFAPSQLDMSDPLYLTRTKHFMQIMAVNGMVEVEDEL